MPDTFSKPARGIRDGATYVPYRRLDRSAIGATIRTGGGKGRRSVASFDEDATTMAVAAGRRLRALTGDVAHPIEALWFASASPAYAERTNATTIHAALRLDPSTSALDMTGSVRAGAASLRAALTGAGTTVLAQAEIRTGMPGGVDEATGGDAAVAVVVGDATDQQSLLATYLGGASAVAEFVDRWRAPGQHRIRRWEDRFAEGHYLDLGARAWRDALDDAGLESAQVTRVAVSGVHARSAGRLGAKLGVGEVAPGIADGIGFCGAADAGVQLMHLIEQASPGDVVGLVSLADGAEAMIFRVEDVPATRDRPSVAEQLDTGGEVDYPTFLRWRDALQIEPPNRPEPARPSSSAAARSGDWKFGFVGAQGETSGAIHMPPAKVSVDASDSSLVPIEMADRLGTVVTFTVDRLVWSVSPPVIFAVVDFDGGGRVPVELTDVDEGEIEIGSRIEMTFRRMYTADGIHNYFWKGRLASTPSSQSLTG